MSLAFALFKEKSRLKALLDHFSILDDPRDPWRVAYPLSQQAVTTMIDELSSNLRESTGRGRYRAWAVI